MIPPHLDVLIGPKRIEFSERSDLEEFWGKLFDQMDCDINGRSSSLSEELIPQVGARLGIA